jgi:hypothetical protein
MTSHRSWRPHPFSLSPSLLSCLQPRKWAMQHLCGVAPSTGAFKDKERSLGISPQGSARALSWYENIESALSVTLPAIAAPVFDEVASKFVLRG